MHKIWTISFLIFLICACASKKQENSKQMNKELGVLNGKVVNEIGIPISEVTVSIVTSPQPVPDVAAITNSKGEFAFDYLKNGTYKLRFIKDDLNIIRTLVFNSENKTIVFKLPD